MRVCSGFLLSQPVHRAAGPDQPRLVAAAFIWICSLVQAQSEPGLSAASIEAEAVWAYSMLQPAARQESP